MPRDHAYQNHAHVILVLTTQYGFTYTGLGDNYEECFHKHSSTPEQVFVHPMHCSHYMDGAPTVIHPHSRKANFESEISDQESQAVAFRKLIVHLDQFTVKIPLVLTAAQIEEQIQKGLAGLEATKIHLQDIVTDRNFDTTKLIPAIYKNLTEYHFYLEQIMSRFKK